MRLLSTVDSAEFLYIKEMMTLFNNMTDRKKKQFGSVFVIIFAIAVWVIFTVWYNQYVNHKVVENIQDSKATVAVQLQDGERILFSGTISEQTKDTFTLSDSNVVEIDVLTDKHPEGFYVIDGGHMVMLLEYCEQLLQSNPNDAELQAIIDVLNESAHYDEYKEATN